MKTLSEKQYEELEKALNHLYDAGSKLVYDRDRPMVKDALSDLQVAMNLIFNIVDPMRD